MSTATANKKLSLPPGPKGHWLFGASYDLMKNPPAFFHLNAPKYNGIFRVSTPFNKIMVLTEPECIKYVLAENNKNYIKSFGYRIIKQMLGEGLLTSEGEFWRKQRRLAQPAFHKERLAMLTQTMIVCIDESIVRLNNLPEKEGVDVSKEMMALTLNVVARAMFSSDVKDFIEVVGEELDVAINLAIARIRNPFRLPTWVPTPNNIRGKKSVSRLNKVIDTIIEERRKSTEHYDDLMAMLMEAKDEDTGEHMTDKQLRDEAMTIFLAGHETTAVALSWIWSLLDNNPEQAQKMYDEIDTVLQGRKPTMEDLRSLEYARLVVDEGMRLYPPAWLIGRQNLEDDEIGGYLVQKGTNVTIPVMFLHKDPRVWDEPEAFRPERFRKENMQDKHRYSYFPFGGGPRQCIGNNFALMEMQLIVVMLAQHFRFKLSKGFEPEMDLLITLRPKHGMVMDVVSV